jgi:hypothetical protein
VDFIEIIERYQGRYQEKYVSRITRDQVKALDAVLACRTERYGKILLNCSSCDIQQVCYQACGHRSCHRCQHYDTTRWLDRQRQKLLPVDYFMATFTLPYELRSLTWHHQKQVYSILIQCAVNTLQDFSRNDPKLGADMGMTVVLHTHSRRLDYHPHVHIIVPGGCMNRQRNQWKKLRGKYLFNEFALAKVFRARFLESMLDAGLTLPGNLPGQWVASCMHMGKGLPALQYLSRYLYRGVISEKNILRDDGEYVTFRYLDSQTGAFKTRREKGETFLWLVFQHVLPKEFRRVRDYGFLHGNAKATLRLIQMVLRVMVQLPTNVRPSHKCRHCGQSMSIIGFMPPAWRSG